MPRGASDRQDEQYVALWPRHVRFAREKAKAMGYAVSGGHGIWQLSDEAPLALRRVVPAVSVTFYVDDEGAPVSAQIRLEGVLPTIHTIRQGMRAISRGCPTARSSWRSRAAPTSI